MRLLVGAAAVAGAGAQGNSCDATCDPATALCVGDAVSDDTWYNICYPDASTSTRATVLGALEVDGVVAPAAAVEGRVTVISNYMAGCVAGRREASLFPHLAQSYVDAYGAGRIAFLSGIKGEAACGTWAGRYEDWSEEVFGTSIVDQPLTIYDADYAIRDLLFTAPYHHPSYVIIADGVIAHKFVGPCCGESTFSDCTDDMLRDLEGTFDEYLGPLLEAQTLLDDVDEAEAEDEGEGEEDECGWSEWSACTVSCGDSGVEYRADSCGGDHETRPCGGALSDCAEQCVLGSAPEITVVAAGFAGARDVAFHPSPGSHLGSFSEGRSFTTAGEEAWVVNSRNHSISIVSGVGTDDATTFSRRDRGYFHYMADATALSFNDVAGSGRDADKDTFGSFATCQDALNTYLDHAPGPNYFMGPTLYDSSPTFPNLVTREGEECGPADACYFLHADMLHEAPECVGIAHDPEVATAYGTVFWAVDSFLDDLVRFDFQQPHGPGLMDHSYAAVRRFVDVPIKPRNRLHAGMVVDGSTRVLYAASAETGEVLAVAADSGAFSRSARGGTGAGVPEYPAFSSRLPSFEYSVYECATWTVFASGLDAPSGLALADGVLYVAEHGTGDVVAFEAATGARLQTIATGRRDALQGMAFSAGSLFAVDGAADELLEISGACGAPYETRAAAAAPAFEALFADASCSVEAGEPLVNASLFEQVHGDSGYLADDDMNSDESAAFGLREDCENPDLNFDMLLLSGFMAHACLPRTELCDGAGGEATAIQWSGYTCDNELHVGLDDGALFVRETAPLRVGVTYRLTIDGVGAALVVKDADDDAEIFDTGVAVGAAYLAVDASTPQRLKFTASGAVAAHVAVAARDRCADDESWFSKSVTSKDCAWVSKKSKRCKVKNRDADDVTAFVGCPRTCATCEVRPEASCDDEDSEWWGWAKKSKGWGTPKDCEWIAKKASKRCKAQVNFDNAAGAKIKVPAAVGCPGACADYNAGKGYDDGCG